MNTAQTITKPLASYVCPFSGKLCVITEFKLLVKDNFGMSKCGWDLYYLVSVDGKQATQVCRGFKRKKDAYAWANGTYGGERFGDHPRLTLHVTRTI